MQKYNMETQAPGSCCAWNGREHQGPDCQVPSPQALPTFWRLLSDLRPPDTPEGHFNKEKFNSHMKSPKADRCIAHPYFCLLRLEIEDFAGSSARDKVKRYVCSCGEQTARRHWNDSGVMSPLDKGKEAQWWRMSHTSEALP